MGIINYLWKTAFALTVLLCFIALPARPNTIVKSHGDIIFSCIEDEAAQYFCTDVPVVNPSIILRLPRFEQKKLSRYVNAFRIMPALTNLTRKTMRSAKVQLTFKEKPKLLQNFIINQKLIPNSQSHTDLSYLIRSDVPAQARLYDELLSTWNNVSFDQIVLKLLEVRYQD
jgi:hypothetical protein